MSTFADQAAIAIENARLFEEVQARTRELEARSQELTESLQQQTATADVLKVISRSAFDLQVVLDTLLESAARLCHAEMGDILLRDDDDSFRYLSTFGFSPEYKEYMTTLPPGASTGTATKRAIATGRTVHIEDVLAEPEYNFLEGQKIGGFRTLLAVPLKRNDQLIGVMTLQRKTVLSFAGKQIELVATFADQAVIAIENARLFDEVQARTRELEKSSRELGEALQQQTATADVLKAISQSTFDLDKVLQTLTESAAKLCNATYGGILLRKGDRLAGSTLFGGSEEDRRSLSSRTYPFDRATISGRVALSGKIEHIEDIQTDPEYGVEHLQWYTITRTMMGVPLLREGKVEGVFFLGKAEPGRFNERQSQLVQSFADQAVIAIENVRLFEEVRARTSELTEALQQQTATADVLKVISRSTFDLKTVLQTLVESAAKLCDADNATITRQIDGTFYRAELHGFTQEFTALVKSMPVMPERGTVAGRALLEGNIIHIADIEADPEYTFEVAKRLGAFRTILGVPMLREGVPIGVLVLTRSKVRPFTGKQIELASTFADQAAIAIENVRLFESVETRTDELARSLEELKSAQDRLIQTEKLASLGQLTAGIAHEIKNPLNFVNNFAAVSVELIDEMKDGLSGAHLDDKVRTTIGELMSMLSGNLNKVSEHGKRADSIVKNMLLHSRQGSGESRLANLNAVLEESLNLAYHGARAERKDFNITLEKSLDPEAGEVDLYPQEITRVFLNLISNGFYATIKRKSQTNGESYEPTLSVSTKNLGDQVEIKIRDNGIGIPPDVRNKIFNPFFTTKPAGEGTGLGLSLSYDIIVKQHAGTIDVDTQPGEFTEFRIVLPRAAASMNRARGST